MNATEPATHRTPSGADHVADAEHAPGVAPGHDLRVGHDDGLVHHSAARKPGRDVRPPARKPMRAISKFIVFVAVAGLAWSAWAAAAFYDLTVGLRDADPIALERRIDWTSVRQALREDLQAGPISPAGGRTVDALLSEHAIANLLQTLKLDDRGWDTAAQPAEGAPDFGWYRIRYAFFSGSPFAFRVDILPDSATLSQPVVLLFRWTGDWRLVRVFLPARDPGLPTLASQSPPPASGLAASSASTGAPRATLYEESPNDPQGKLYSGSTTWRTERIPPVEGAAPGLAVVAHVSIPDRPLTATISIRRNFDRTLPASHTIDVNFDLPANSAAHGIQDMVGIMMKPNQEAPGQNLAGTRVKVRDGYFLFGLSAIELDVQHNTQILKDRPWFGIPFRYSNGSRGVLVIEKGASGEKSLAEGFAQWSATAATEARANKNKN